MFAIGSFSIALAIVGAQDVVPGSLGVAQPLVIIFIAGVLVPIGLAAIGVSLLRSNGLARVAGLSICVGGPVACLGLFLVVRPRRRGMPAEFLLVGVVLIGVGTVAVGLLATEGSARG